MDNETLARNFRAISHPRRAMIFRLLAENPDAGQGFERLVQTTRLAESSLTHHLREMERCGLIRRHRRGTNVSYMLGAGEFTMALGAAMRLGEASRGRRARIA